jgi:hypothetical protein
VTGHKAAPDCDPDSSRRTWRTMRRIGVLINPASVDTAEQRHQVETSSAAMEVAIQFVEARTPDLEAAFQTFMSERAEALLVLYDALFFRERRRIAAPAAAARIDAPEI